ncbi:unnamed protein product [Cylindrotheca closterium]|uniref:peptidyl-tRNA hydrolase n=1 Tax=Cylindrotheca closterium TaxID=2856 RepID=A0AAD2JPQ3_9STRA|nr:unnamed protein product [Cylindrotheca closterium]
MSSSGSGSGSGSGNKNDNDNSNDNNINAERDDGGIPSSFSKPVVQYIFCRRDLSDEEGIAWPTGAVAAQVAHASVAAMAEGLAKQDEATKYYLSPEQLPSMTKYVYGVDSMEELEKVKQGFEEKFGNDSYHCWLEQPENIPTALATLPMERTNKVSKFVQKLKVSYL